MSDTFDNCQCDYCDNTFRADEKPRYEAGMVICEKCAAKSERYSKKPLRFATTTEYRISKLFSEKERIKGERAFELAKIVGAVVAIFCFVFFFYFMAQRAIRLSMFGKAAEATVVAYEPKEGTVRRNRQTEKVTYNYHRIVYEGHEETVDLGQFVDLGTIIDIRYIPSDPKVVAIASPDDTWIDIVHREGVGSWASLILLGVSVVCLVFLWRRLKTIRLMNARLVSLDEQMSRLRSSIA